MSQSSIAAACVFIPFFSSMCVFFLFFFFQFFPAFPTGFLSGGQDHNSFRLNFSADLILPNFEVTTQSLNSIIPQTSLLVNRTSLPLSTSLVLTLLPFSLPPLIFPTPLIRILSCLSERLRPLLPLRLVTPPFVLSTFSRFPRTPSSYARLPGSCGRAICPSAALPLHVRKSACPQRAP